MLPGGWSSPHGAQPGTWCIGLSRGGGTFFSHLHRAFSRRWGCRGMPGVPGLRDLGQPERIGGPRRAVASHRVGALVLEGVAAPGCGDPPLSRRGWLMLSGAGCPELPGCAAWALPVSGGRVWTGTGLARPAAARWWLVTGAGLLGRLCGRRFLCGGAARTPGTQPWPPLATSATHPSLGRPGMGVEGFPSNPPPQPRSPPPPRHPPSRPGVEGVSAVPGTRSRPRGRQAPGTPAVLAGLAGSPHPRVRRPTPQSPWVAEVCLVCHAWCGCGGVPGAPSLGVPGASVGACCVWSRPPSPRLPPLACAACLYPLVGAARTPGIRPCPWCTPGLGGVRRARNPRPWGRGFGGVRGLRPLRPALSPRCPAALLSCALLVWVRGFVLGAFAGVWWWGERGVPG